MNKPPERSPGRVELFWRQLDRASKDVAAWPAYLKRAFGIPTEEPGRKTDRRLRFCNDSDERTELSRDSTGRAPLTPEEP